MSVHLNIVRFGFKESVRFRYYVKGGLVERLYFLYIGVYICCRYSIFYSYSYFIFTCLTLTALFAAESEFLFRVQ